MAITNNNINVSELDFDKIKENLKEYFRGQDEWKDYDFDGSGLSVFMDVLAYNTHYNNLYQNLALNESFLDSASKRASVVSLAKSLGYVPRSATCSRAVVDMRIISPTAFPTVLTLPAYQPFETNVGSQQYTFYNVGSYTTNYGVNGYVFSDVELVEGTPLTFSYTVAAGQKFIIPNQNVDLSTVRVIVQDSATSGNFKSYTKADNIVNGINKTSKVFFIKEIEGGLYEITFGNDILGKSLLNGNVVTINYFVSGLSGPNGARLFTYNGASSSGSVLLGGTANISTKTVATGGNLSEDLDSIKFNAPRLYAAQNRAVTPEDYKTLILSGFSAAASVACWGGENNYPAIYGKVYICVRPRDATKLTTLEKNYILQTVLSNKNMVSVTPEIVDPEYINIALNVTVYYNPNETTKTESQIKTIATNAIFDYDDMDLKRFDGVFRHSKLSRLIDMSDPAIVSNTTTVLLRRKMVVKYNVSSQYILNIVNPLYNSGIAEGAIYSTGLYIQGSNDIHYLDDDGQGFIRLYTLDTSYQKAIVNPAIGTVNYDAGYIQISNLNITGLADIDFEISMKPKSNDVVSALHQVAEVARDHLTVTIVADKAAAGDLGAGFNYTFTNSRP
jgi:hypothetical protein